MVPSTRTLFATDRLLARHVRCGEAARCVVTFEAFSDAARLDRPGFGEAFFRDRGVDAIHVLGTRNDWYLNADMPDALAAIRQAAAGYGRIVTYGSSMGGYAAIRFAGHLGAALAIAISPQHSANPRAPPFDRRWSRHVRGVDFARELAPERPAEVLAIFDPLSLDARHVALIAERHAVTPLRLPHAGHPAGAYLAEIGMLADTVLSAVNGTLDAADAERRARAGRRRSGQYLFSLARHTPPWRAAQRERLARLALDAVPDEAAYAGYLARLVEERDPAAARHLYETVPGRVSPQLSRHARFLGRAGEFAAGARRALAAARAASDDTASWRLAARLLLAAGRPGAAARACRHAWTAPGGGWLDASALVLLSTLPTLRRRWRSDRVTGLVVRAAAYGLGRRPSRMEREIGAWWERVVARRRRAERAAIRAETRGRAPLRHAVLAGIGVLLGLFGGRARAEPVDLLPFMVQFVCTDPAGRVLPVSPLDPTCRARPQRAEDRAGYRKHDRPGAGDASAPFGYQASDSVLARFEGMEAVVQTFDFGTGGRVFGRLDRGIGDGGQVVVLLDGAAFGAFTEDGGAGRQWFVGPGCSAGAPARYRGWLFAKPDLRPGEWTAEVARLGLARSADTCPRGTVPAFTRYRLEQVDLGIRDLTRSGPARDTVLPTVVSEHYGRDAIERSDHLERFYFARPLGLARWERWENPRLTLDRDATRRAEQMRANRRCAPVAWSVPPEPDWVMTDCRSWTTLLPSRDGFSVGRYGWP